MQPVPAASTCISFTDCLLWSLKAALLSTEAWKFQGIEALVPDVPVLLSLRAMYVLCWLPNFFHVIKSQLFLPDKTSFTVYFPFPVSLLYYPACVSWGHWINCLHMSLGILLGNPKLRHLSCHDCYAYWSVFVLGADCVGNCQSKAQNLSKNFFRWSVIMSHREMRQGEEGQPFLSFKDYEKKTKVTILPCSAPASRTFSSWCY